MPTIRILTSNDQPALESFLLPRVETSMFLLGNSRTAGLVDNRDPYQGTYAAAFEKADAGSAMTGVVAHYWNGMLIPQAPTHLDELWRAAARASGRPIAGALGPSAQVEAILEGWRVAGTGRASGSAPCGVSPLEGSPTQQETPDVQLDQVEKLYSLSLDALRVPEALRDGTLRAQRLTARDLEQVVAWRVAFQVESLNQEDTPHQRESTRASVARALERGHAWVVKARLAPAGSAKASWVPVSTSGFNAVTREAVQIGGVYTPPALRSRGYARAAVAASLLAARAEGVETAILFTGVENVPAQKAYTALGFRHIGEYRLLLLRTPIDAHL